MTSTVLPDLFSSRDASHRAQVRESLNAEPDTLLQTLVAHHSELVLAYIRKFVPDPEDACDLLQDVWLQILRKNHTYAGAGSFLGWALTIARNTCLSALRSPDRRYTLQPAADPGDGSWRQHGFEARTPDVVADQRALRRDLFRAIDNLAPGQRAVVMLRLVEGRSTREAATLLGCSTGTVKGSLFRAKRQLRTELAHWRS
jgi:RNA polymerase sigma-70 factor (ECF subfamily)